MCTIVSSILAIRQVYLKGFFLIVKKQANLCKDPWDGSLVVLGWRLVLGSLLGLEEVLICCEGEEARNVLQTKNNHVITDNRPMKIMY